MAMKLIRKAEASWQGDVPTGAGRLALGSGAYEGPFTLRARVEEGVRSPNPEELLGVAHAGCFTMSLADMLSSAGNPPSDLRTVARVHLEQLETGYTITRIELRVTGEVPGVEEAEFVELAQRAKATCPVSRALAGTEITLEASLPA